MKNRCYAATEREFPRYQGRGIRVCERWIKSFADFLADMGECPVDHTIERQDNDGNYEPANCIWLPRKLQARNRSTTNWIVLNGERKTIPELAAEYGLKYCTLHDRLRRQRLPIEQALATPRRAL